MGKKKQVREAGRIINASLHVQLDWLYEHRGDVEFLLESHRDSPEALWLHRALNYITAAQYSLGRDTSASTQGQVVGVLKEILTDLRKGLEDGSVKITGIPLPFSPETHAARAIIADSLGKDIDLDVPTHLQGAQEMRQQILDASTGLEADATLVNMLNVVIYRLIGVVERDEMHSAADDDTILAAYLLDGLDLLHSGVTENVPSHEIVDTFKTFGELMASSQIEAVRDVGRELTALVG